MLLNFFQLCGIIKIKQKFKLNKKFSFQCVFVATVWKLPSDKATTGEIPVNVLKNSETCLFELTELRILTRKKNHQMKLQCLGNSINSIKYKYWPLGGWYTKSVLYKRFLKLVTATFYFFCQIIALQKL